MGDLNYYHYYIGENHNASEFLNYMLLNLHEFEWQYEVMTMAEEKRLDDEIMNSNEPESLFEMAEYRVHRYISDFIDFNINFLNSHYTVHPMTCLPDLKPMLVRIQAPTVTVKSGRLVTKEELAELTPEEVAITNRLRLERFFQWDKEGIEQSIKIHRDLMDYYFAPLPSNLYTKAIKELVEFFEKQQKRDEEDNYYPLEKVLQVVFTRHLRILQLNLTDHTVRHHRKVFKSLKKDELLRFIERMIVVLEIECRQGRRRQTPSEKIYRCYNPTDDYLATRVDFHDVCADQNFPEKPDMRRCQPVEPVAADSRHLIRREAVLAHHLVTMCPHLQTLILPFVSNSVLYNVAGCRQLQVFKNVYRSDEVSDRGLRMIMAGPARLTLTNVHLRLTACAARKIRRITIQRMLWHMPRLEVLDFSDKFKSHRNYLVAGGSHLTMDIGRCLSNTVVHLPPLHTFKSPLKELVVYGEMGQDWNVDHLAERCPSLVTVRLFTWHGALYWTQAWRQLSSRLQTLELVGYRLNYTTGQRRRQLDLAVFGALVHLKQLILSHWIDSEVDLSCLLATFPALQSLMLVNMVINTTSSSCHHGDCVTYPHRAMWNNNRDGPGRSGGPAVVNLQIHDCATNNPYLGISLPRLFPGLTQLCIDGLVYDNSQTSSVGRWLQNRENKHDPVICSLEQMKRDMPHLQKLHLRITYLKVERNWLFLEKILFEEKGWPNITQMILFNFLGMDYSNLNMKPSPKVKPSPRRLLRDLDRMTYLACQIHRPHLYLEIN